MYCGGRKFSSSSSQASIISRVFRASWFPNKLKQKGDNPNTNSSKSPHHHYPTSISPLSAVKKEVRFYSVEDDDAFWRFSFSEEKKSIFGIPVSYSEDESQIPVASFRNFCSREMEHKRIMCKHKEKFTSPRKKYTNDRSSRKSSRRAQLELMSSESVERDIFPVETTYKVQTEEGFQVSPVSSLENEDCEIRRVSISESLCTRRVEQKNQVKNNSMKRKFRVRAFEDMKKERTWLKYKETTIYDSFAEVKNSFQPQQDFRDSMVEMICEKRIRRSEELEDLLACYLTLNCDEYHDLIIKVFQQVWFELS